MEIKRNIYNNLITFFLILIFTSTIGYTLTLQHHMGSTTLMWSVGFAAIFTCLLRKMPLQNIGWKFGDWKFTWLSLFIPFVYSSIAYGLIWVSGLGEFNNETFTKKLANDFNLANLEPLTILIFYFFYLLTVGMANSIIAALGEEIGWRGFLAPQLSKVMSFGGVCIISGIIWSMWHWPLIFMKVYGSQNINIYYQLACFTLFLTSMSVIMTYIRFKTNNIWNAAIFHASHNIWIQKFFTPMTVSNGNSDWYIDEFGAVPSLTAFVVALYFYKKGKKEFRNG